MKAIIATGKGPAFKQVEDPVLRGGSDVCVRVCATAICRTDLYAAQGRLPVDNGRVLGHEFTGVVEAVGPDARFGPGDRVVANPSVSCGVCPDCKSGDSHLCADTRFLGLDLDGAFAERIVVPDTALYPLSDGLSFSVGTFAEPVAAGMAVFEAGLDVDARILVAGEGRIAELTGELLADAGFGKLEVAGFGAVDAKGCYDAIIETEGLGSRSSKAFELLVPGGTLVLKSRRPEMFTAPVLDVIRRRIRMIAVKYGRFENALDYVVRRSETLADRLDAGWRLEDFERAFELAERSEERKLCFTISD